MHFLAILPTLLLSALALAAPDAGLARRQATITSAPLFATGTSAGSSGGTTVPGGPAVNPGNYTMPTSLTAVPTNPATSSASAAGASSSGTSKTSGGERRRAADVAVGAGAAVIVAAIAMG